MAFAFLAFLAFCAKSIFFFTDLDVFIELVMAITKNSIDQLPVSERLVYVARQLLKESLQYQHSPKINTILLEIAEQIIAKRIHRSCLQYLARKMLAKGAQATAEGATKGVAGEVLFKEALEAGLGYAKTVPKQAVIFLVMDTAISAEEIYFAYVKYCNGEIDKCEFRRRCVRSVSSGVGSTVGGVGGATLGTFIGAIIGALIVPGVGTKIGASIGRFIGSVLGGTVGAIVGEYVGEYINQKLETAMAVCHTNESEGNTDKSGGNTNESEDSSTNESELGNTNESGDNDTSETGCNAAHAYSDDDVIIKSGQKISIQNPVLGDVYIHGGDKISMRTVQGDVYIYGGNRISIHTVQGDIHITGGQKIFIHTIQGDISISGGQRITIHILQGNRNISGGEGISIGV